MDELQEAIASIATTLHGDRIEAIAKVAERAECPTRFGHFSSTFMTAVNTTLLDRLNRGWAANPSIPGQQIAFSLRAAALTASAMNSAERIDIVWTGPKTGLIPTRNTEQVIKEVIDEAGTSLFVVSYVFYNASSIVDSLNQAAERGVSISILLESSSEHGGTISTDSILAMHHAVPKADLYLWNPAEKARNAGALTAAVHAKCAVADHRIAFVTSANLTCAAMERNMELGVLIRGRSTAERLQNHLNALAQTRTIIRWG